MAQNRRKSRKRKGTKTLETISAIILILASVLAYYLFNDFFNNPGVALSDSVQSDVSVHFINVGQGDSTLIKVEDKYILIDAGETDKGSLVVDYLNSQGVGKIELLIITHPHSDHIGGMDKVIDYFEIGEILMPELTGDNIPTTKTYQDVLYSIANKGYSITAPTVGKVYDFHQAHLTILGPAKEYNNLNNDSIVAKFQFGNISFMLSGDIEKEAESDLLKQNLDLSSTVFFINHHGSRTSNTEKFLDAVDASYYVISVGAGNSYGHPDEEILLRVGGSPIYRTDENGTIVFTTDGNELSVQTER